MEFNRANRNGFRTIGLNYFNNSGFVGERPRRLACSQFTEFLSFKAAELSISHQDIYRLFFGKIYGTGTEILMVPV